MSVEKRGLKPIPWAPAKIELQTVPCPICGKTDFQFLRRAENVLLEQHKFTRRGYEPYPMHPEESRIVRCRHCRLVQVNPRRRPEDLFGLNNALHLVKNYKDGKIEGGEILPGPGDEEVRMDRIGRILAIKNRGRWLDIGCGSGRDLDIVIENGFEGFGVELSDVKKDFYKGRKFEAFVGRLEDAPFADAMFDVITMWDVLEHVEDPNSVLEKIGRILKPDGIFVAKVPNYGALNRRINGRWWDMYHPLHLYYFTVRTLGRLLAKHGMGIVHTCSLNPYGFGTLLKDAKKYWDGDPRRNDAALAAANVSPQPPIQTSGAGPNPPPQGGWARCVAKNVFKYFDRLPKKISLALLAGNFLVVYAQKR